MLTQIRARPIRFERSRNAVKGPRFITQLTNRKTSSLQHERSRSAVVALVPVQCHVDLWLMFANKWSGKTGVWPRHRTPSSGTHGEAYTLFMMSTKTDM
jgi:hypothetical protein